MLKLLIHHQDAAGSHNYQLLASVESSSFRSTTTNLETGPDLPVVVTGLSGKVPELVNVDTTKRDNVPIIRRFTGGGTVVVDKNTIFATFIMNSDDIDTDPYPREIMKWTEGFYKGVFNNVNPEFSLRENDYVIGDLKIGGNAQAIAKRRFVHHTSFLWSFSPNAMNYLKKMPDYRQQRDHAQFLTELRKQYGTAEEVEARFRDQLGSTFDVLELSPQGRHESLESHVRMALADRNLREISRTKFVDL